MGKRMYTRGWSLSEENVLALKAEAFELTLKSPKTVSVNKVLEDIVTAWRKGRERQAKVNDAVKKVKHGESRSGV